MIKGNYIAKIKVRSLGSYATFRAMTEEEFDIKYTEALDTLLGAMAENEEIDHRKFYSMTCILENLRFFSPVIYGVIQNAKKK
ncbi:hypothetical protein [Pontibacter ruber]|uniref:Uncharacterized protein n=1 Tax=Pontibacter ruber TaxID=1343895 RepID=A0ABW5D149_9BACT|nr:hypothetical protein [Pontibacter ruber]